MVTTTLALVIITTLIFGTFMKLAQRVFLPQDKLEDNMLMTENAHTNKSLNIQQ